MPIVQSSFQSPTQQSVTDFVSTALRLIGSLASGAEPTASEIKDAGMTLNQMIDAWNAERLSVFQLKPTSHDQNGNPLMLVSGQQSYVLGQANPPKPDWFLPRPARIETASVLYSASQPTPVEQSLGAPLTEIEWQAISNKTTQSLLPQCFYDDGGFPNRRIFMWPVPTQGNPMVLYPWGLLTEFTDYKTAIAFPPGYAEAIKFGFAERLMLEWPGDPQRAPGITRMAIAAKNRIKSVNAPIKVAQCGDEWLTSTGRGNIYTGLPNRNT